MSVTTILHHQDTQATPGELLRAAREAHRLAIEEVAARLNLTVDQVSKLENDDYRQNPGLVFVRGYLRTYARLLGMDATRVLQAFDRLGITEPAWILDATTNINSGSGFNERQYRWIIYLIMLGFLVLVGMWWQTQNPRFLKRAHHVLHHNHTVKGVTTTSPTPESSIPAYAEVESLEPAHT